MAWPSALHWTPHLAYLTDGLGTHWEILANTYKPFPCGIVIHPLIEAALEIAQELNTAAEAVARVEIIANPAAMALCYRRHPKDEMEGHVSLYHWVAAALARGKAGIPEGTDQAIADPAIRALRDRIDVTNDRLSRTMAPTSPLGSPMARAQCVVFALALVAGAAP
jgi:2-methylcitrate dehydratase PrpD